MKSVRKTSVVPFLIGAALIFAYAPTCSAEIAVNCDPSPGRLCFIQITGTITAEDARVVAKIPAEIGRGNPSRVVRVNLNSRGGDTEAAMAIGRVLRGLHVIALVGMDQVCASACVLLLAAGTMRFVATIGLPGQVKGRVGIHRLYSMSTSEKDYDSLQRKYQQIESKVRAYLKDMNVPESLYFMQTWSTLRTPHVTVSPNQSIWPERPAETVNARLTMEHSALTRPCGVSLNAKRPFFGGTDRRHEHHKRGQPCRCNRRHANATN